MAILNCMATKTSLSTIGMTRKKVALYPGGRSFPAKDTEGTESLTQKNLASSRNGKPAAVPRE